MLKSSRPCNGILERIGVNLHCAGIDQFQSHVLRATEEAHDEAIQCEMKEKCTSGTFLVQSVQNDL